MTDILQLEEVQTKLILGKCAVEQIRECSCSYKKKSHIILLYACIPERISMFMSFIYFYNYCMIAMLHLHQQIQSLLQRRMLDSPP